MSVSTGDDSATTLSETAADLVVAAGPGSRPHVVAVCGTRPITGNPSWIAQLPRHVREVIREAGEGVDRLDRSWIRIGGVDSERRG
jgi:hypothetical protein